MEAEEIINRLNSKLETFADKLSKAYDDEGQVRYELWLAHEDIKNLKEKIDVLEAKASA